MDRKEVAIAPRLLHRRDPTMRHHLCCRCLCQPAQRYQIQASTRVKCSRPIRRFSILTRVMLVKCHLRGHIIYPRVLRAEVQNSGIPLHCPIRLLCCIQLYWRQLSTAVRITDTLGWTATTELATAILATSATMEFSLQYPLLILICKRKESQQYFCLKFFSDKRLKFHIIIKLQKKRY